ncbi:MAG: hypothetical protein QOD74_1593, partial [Variibacter sp.]|nr:hypothetical protein [Variibacter sp.]
GELSNSALREIQNMIDFRLHPSGDPALNEQRTCRRPRGFTRLAVPHFLQGGVLLA